MICATDWPLVRLLNTFLQLRHKVCYKLFPCLVGAQNRILKLLEGILFIGLFCCYVVMCVRHAFALNGCPKGNVNFLPRKQITNCNYKVTHTRRDAETQEHTNGHTNKGAIHTNKHTHTYICIHYSPLGLQLYSLSTLHSTWVTIAELSFMRRHVVT